MSVAGRVQDWEPAGGFWSRPEGGCWRVECGFPDEFCAGRRAGASGGPRLGTRLLAGPLRSGGFGVRADFQSPPHEARPSLPTGKVPIAGEGAQILKEGFARGQGGADQAVLFVGKARDGVAEEGQDVHRRQERGEMFLAVAKVECEMIALGFKGVVVFVFDLPTRAARSDQGEQSPELLTSSAALRRRPWMMGSAGIQDRDT